MTTTLGELIRERRQARGLSLRALARAADASAPHISDIELGRRLPSSALLRRIAKELRVDGKEFARFDGRQPLADAKRLAATSPAFVAALRALVTEHGGSGR
jgi:transcriptional regulator with XRE-family HTH domain